MTALAIRFRVFQVSLFTSPLLILSRVDSGVSSYYCHANMMGVILLLIIGQEAYSVSIVS